MDKLLLLVLAQIIMDPDLRDQAAQRVAEFLTNALPDVTQDDLNAFLSAVSEKLSVFD